MNDCLMQLEKVGKVYEGPVSTPVLFDIDLGIERAEFTAIIGPSGSGKSTMLNLMGLLDRPSSGKLFFSGTEASALGDRELTRFRGRNIGFIFQFHHLLRAFTARENVMMPMLIDRGVDRAAAASRARELLVRVGLESKVDTPSGKLSGGQQQRVAIARALALSPALVLADEPTGNLDTESADQIFDLLQETNAKEGTAILVVTHDPRLADRCRRIIRLVDGRIRSDTSGPEAGPCRTCGYDHKGAPCPRERHLRSADIP